MTDASLPTEGVTLLDRLRDAPLGSHPVDLRIEAANEIQRLQRADRIWRQMLAFSYSTANLYGDDGELQDNTLPHPIDYVRDTAEQVQAAIHARGFLKMEEAIRKHGSVEAAMRAAQSSSEPEEQWPTELEASKRAGAIALQASALRAERVKVLEEQLADTVPREILLHAVECIQTWHNMGMKPKVASETWDIYWRKSPEMERIRLALTKAERQP